MRVEEKNGLERCGAAEKAHGFNPRGQPAPSAPHTPSPPSPIPFVFTPPRVSCTAAVRHRRRPKSPASAPILATSPHQVPRPTAIVAAPSLPSPRPSIVSTHRPAAGSPGLGEVSVCASDGIRLPLLFACACSRRKTPLFLFSCSQRGSCWPLPPPCTTGRVLLISSYVSPWLPALDQRE